MHQIAMIADIEKAFLQIMVHERDRDALRCLWYRDVTFREMLSNELCVLRMSRVPFGTTASPFLLAATLHHHFRHITDDLRDTASDLLSSFYVDDLVTGADNVEEATRMHRQALAVIEQAGVRLRKWASNEPQLKSVFKKGETDESIHQKVLGIPWNTETDSLMPNLEAVKTFVATSPVTKRNILQGTARLFDPLGFLNPFTFRARSMFQDLGKKKVGWDEDIPCDAQQKWSEWCNELSTLSALEIPRCVVPANASAFQMHIFCDASPLGYGAVAYLRTANTKGEISTHLILSKTRLAPIKQLSLPRLELMGMLIGARMLTYLQRTLYKLQFDYFMWTDSMIALWWIRRRPTEWKVFVSNRVKEIQRLTEISHWAHCPGTENPADHLTRGITALKLISSQSWWHGPKWLAGDCGCWPNDFVEQDPRTDEERLQCQALLQVALQQWSPLLDLDAFGKYSRVLRTTAWILRFITNCRHHEERLTGPLSADELLHAETYWVRTSQAATYPDEVYALREKLEFPTNSKIANLQPFLDATGVLRLKGRLHYADEVEQVKHPIIISKEHRLAHLIAYASHHRTLHGGLQDTMNDLREKWWIPHARQFVKTVIFRCPTCKRFRLQPARAPTAPLPAERVTPILPFEVAGVDFVGPVFVKTDDGSKRSYISLFTCAVTKAVHFELISNLGANAFLLAFRRFVSRRGIPSVMYSDNALTFKRAAKDIQKLGSLIRQDDVQNYMATTMISWRFMPERAPWWGGFWERLVRTLKHALRRVIGKQSLTIEEMETVLAEAEAAVNSRPITYLHSSPNEPTALTPAHLLVGKRLIALPSSKRQDPTRSTTEALSRRWVHQQKIADHFWKRWHKDYLWELRSAHVSRTTPSHSMKEGDLVLVHEERTPRQVWKTARIVKFHRGRDGENRSCSVKLPSGNITRRPVQQLYPFEDHLQCASDAHSGGGRMLRNETCSANRA
ncbi:uncharacterized protein LOC135395790 [Ornithodoros turicata]|uniref:uncharacterized protein LOC135395790 n=1 Tax=Ornithodoros turicata TaxID=34597 RepID=UPI0031393D8F